LRQRITDFWNEVTEGVAMAELWQNFKRDARQTYKLYSADIERSGKLDAVPKKKRHWAMWKAFFWAVLMKLSPPRRVVLLIALVFWVMPDVTFGSVSIHTEGFHFWSLLLLLGLLVAEVADRVTMKRDLEIAREIQSWLVPESAPEVPGYDFAFTMRPANTVAGDYYDIFWRDGAAGGRKLLIAVADVAGKSMPAALLMAGFQASLRTLAATAVSLPELAAGLNRHACSQSQGGRRFITAFISELDPASGELNYINAGHDAPILRRQSGALEQMSSAVVPLGIDPALQFVPAAVVLAPGDMLTIYTDGLPEAVNDHGADYTLVRLQEMIRTRGAGSASQLLQAVMADLNQFVGAASQHDDITCVAVARK
jgi:sigma-B regulation protein RsbU (phosphoserine phosphatase)